MKVNKLIIIEEIAVLISLVLIGAFAWFLLHKNNVPITLRNMKQENIQVGNQIFHVWVAQTPKEQTRGLMFVKRLPKNDGMLFVWDHYVMEPFWMKNTLIPLTILFIKDGRVIKQMNMKPCRAILCPVYNPNTEYNMALEINQTNQNYVGEIVRIIPSRSY
jgi:uncharacterized membrane protein (UPF0127 family)